MEVARDAEGESRWGVGRAGAWPSKIEMSGGVNASDDGTMHETRQDNHAAQASLLCAANVMTPLLTWISKEWARSAKFVMRAPTNETTEVGFPIWSKEIGRASCRERVCLYV